MDKSKKINKIKDGKNGFVRTIGNTGTRTMDGVKRIIKFFEQYTGKVYNKYTAYDMFIDMVMEGVYFPESPFFSEYEKNYNFVKYSREFIIEKLNENFITEDSKDKDLYDYANKTVKKFFVGLMNMGLCIVVSNKPMILTPMGEAFLNNLKKADEEIEKYGKQSKENILMYQAILSSIFAKMPQNSFSYSRKYTRKQGNKKRVCSFLLGVLFNLGEMAPKELLFVSAWHNHNIRQCIATIEDFRVRPYYGTAGVVDYLIEICNLDRDSIYKYSKTTSKEETENNLIKVFTNQLIPFYQEAGLIEISSEGNIRLNYNNISKINYIINTYNEFDGYNSYEEQFNDMQIIDENLLVDSYDIVKKSESIKEYASLHDIEYLKNKILVEKNLASKAGDSFELNTNLFLQKLCPTAVSLPNYTFDDKMKVRYHAPHGKCDYIMTGDEYTVACEVSLKSRDRDQIRDELESITRHIEELYVNNNGKVFGIFIAPNLGSDYIMYMRSFNIFNSLMNKKSEVKIAILSLEELFELADRLLNEKKEVTIDTLYFYFMEKLEEESKFWSKLAYEKYCINSEK